MTVPCYLKVIDEPAGGNKFYQSASGCDHIEIWTDPF